MLSLQIIWEDFPEQENLQRSDSAEFANFHEQEDLQISDYAEFFILPGGNIAISLFANWETSL